MSQTQNRARVLFLVIFTYFVKFFQFLFVIFVYYFMILFLKNRLKSFFDHKISKYAQSREINHIGLLHFIPRIKIEKRRLYEEKKIICNYFSRFSCCRNGVDNESNLLLAFRAYLDETNIGPSYYEIIYDRAIVFHKK